jgi:hypothetical protein
MIVTLLMLITLFVRNRCIGTRKLYVNYEDLDKVMQRLGLENDSTAEPSLDEK